MPIIKVIELIAQSEKGWEDAAQKALSEASKTLRGIKNIYVQDMQAVVENGRITQYRLNAKISFLVSEERQVSSRGKK
jgi:flavin-binding protein dodecin